MDGDKYSYILINTWTGSEISAISKVTRLCINRLCILFGCWHRPLLLQAYDHTDRKITSCNALFHPSCTCCYNEARTVGGLIEQVRCPPLISHTCSIRRCLVIMLAREVVELFELYVEQHIQPVGRDYPTETSFLLPIAGMATESVEQCSRHVYCCSIFPPQIPKVKNL